MADIKDRAREYLAEHSEYSEVFGETFVAVDTLTAMVDFAKRETKELEQKLGTERNSRIALVNKIAELEAQIEQMKCCENCAFFKDKTYDICHRIKKLGTRKCAFYKMI